MRPEDALKRFVVRLKAGRYVDRDSDADMMAALGYKVKREPSWRAWNGGVSRWTALPRLTGSVDALLRMVPHSYVVVMSRQGDDCRAWIYARVDGVLLSYVNVPREMAYAVCLAWLKVIAADSLNRQSSRETVPAPGGQHYPR